ncbi:MAG: peroxiredoxin [Pseudomonadota bacterium]|nr:peroxiredoxin [Pseudomonadota bacterium]
MTISVGSKLPEATFKIMTADGPTNITTKEIFSGKTVAAFAVPGAFTPTCHAKHVPGFLDKMDALKSKGVDEVVCIAVNDHFVLNAWAKDTGAKDKIRFLADSGAEFTKAIGMEFDASAGGLGTRSRRYAMLVKDGVVKALNIEDAPGKAEISSAENLLKSL